MRMTVVDVGVMGMLMSQDLVPMLMHMRLFTTPGKSVSMLVMLIVAVRMVVLERLVRVDVLVPLSKVQPYADPHEDRCPPETRAGQLRP